jgi:glycosyltransferase involved in cell wall biosynthesis
MTARCLVVSAINLTEGGTLTILREFLAAASETLPSEWKIVAFVHDRRLFDIERPIYREISAAKGSWLRRLYLEWHGFRAYARELRPDLWVSLHDITPSVGAVRQAVYCHNPMPFYPMRLRDMWLQPVLIAFRLGYAMVYRIHMQRNYAVVVQQAWLREKFRRWVGSGTRIIVAHPTVAAYGVPAAGRQHPGGGATFIYPALPRVFKNIELLCRAVACLEGNSAWRSQVVLTIDKGENRYARWLWRKFGHLQSVRFMGRQTPQQMRLLYENSDCLIFPSLLETWGLPITEAKQWGLPIFAADMPYARETMGHYERVEFIDVKDHRSLAVKMLQFQEGNYPFAGARGAEPAAPFTRDWRGLLAQLTEGLA